MQQNLMASYISGPFISKWTKSKKQGIENKKVVSLQRLFYLRTYFLRS